MYCIVIFKCFNMDKLNFRFRLIKGLMDFKVIYIFFMMFSEIRFVFKYLWMMLCLWRNFIVFVSCSIINFILLMVRGWVFIWFVRVIVRGVCFLMMKELLL